MCFNAHSAVAPHTTYPLPTYVCLQVYLTPLLCSLARLSIENMALSPFRKLLLVVATIGLAQARHVPATTVVKYVVTSSLPTVGVVRKESSYQNDNNYNNKSNIIDNNNVSSILDAAKHHANAEYPNQTALSLEDNGNGDAFTVNISTPKSVVQDWSSVCQQLCG